MCAVLGIVEDIEVKELVMLQTLMLGFDFKIRT